MMDLSITVGIKIIKRTFTLSQGREPIRILIIPHQPNRNVRVRSLELARHLASKPEYEVYVLSWRLRERSHPNPFIKFGFKIQQNMESGSIEPQTREEKGIHWVRLPHLLAPHLICQDFNLKQLQKFVKKNRIQVIISGNTYHFPMPKRSSLLRIYDVLDDYISPNTTPNWRLTRGFIQGELKKADYILTISHALQVELEKLGYNQSIRIPNGAAWQTYTTDNSKAIESIKERYGLQNSFIITCIGNHDWWTDMDFLLEAFSRVRIHVPNSRLLIVGPGNGLPECQKPDPDRPGVIYTGPIPPDEIAAYFQVSHLGVVPYIPCPFTHKALPLKVLEYGAARKRVLAPPLTELATLQLPHVQLLEPDKTLWSETLIQESLEPTPWDPDWDQVIQQYDWPQLWHPVEQILETHFGVQNEATV